MSDKDIKGDKDGKRGEQERGDRGMVWVET